MRQFTQILLSVVQLCVYFSCFVLLLFKSIIDKMYVMIVVCNYYANYFQ